MRLGAIFPQTEIGTDPSAIRDFAQAVEATGYSYLEVYDHVLGANIERRPGWLGYTMADMFHEVLVLLGYLAGCTNSIVLSTGILILPQRQTALVAKQAAEVDVLSRGRLRLGVGIGWNSVEYEALGVSFRRRGAIVEEQVGVLRELWTRPSVTFHGRWHHIVEAGLNPLPVQRPIPIWMGGEADAVLRRVARLADGWIPGGGLQNQTTRHARVERAQQMATLRTYLREANRDPASLGIEGRLTLAGGGPDEWRRAAEEWRALGATHLGIATMRAGWTRPQEHIEAVERARDVLGDLASS